MKNAHSGSLMQRMSLNMLLMGIMAMLVIFLLLLAAAGTAGNRLSSQALAELKELGVGQLNAANRAQLNTSLAREELGDYLDAWREGAPQAEVVAQRDAARRALGNAQRRYSELAALPVDPQSERASYLEALGQHFTHLLNGLFTPALETSQLAEALAIQSRIRSAERELDQAMREFVRFAETRALEFQERDAQFSRLITIASLVLIVLALTAVVLARWMLVRHVLRPVDDALGHLGAISEGDLTRRVDVAGCKEISTLLSGLSAMQQQLGTLVGQIKQSTDSINLGADEIAKGGEDLAARTEEQASALQQTAASMEELTATVKHNAGHAQEADGLTASAATTAEQSGEELQRTLTMMAQLSESSRQVQQIVDTIDAITFQTNILALNASVEAARAGEHGRGFAVVAQEVRTLASRSSTAAKEIRQILGENVKQITQSAQQAEKSGSMLKEMVAAIQRVSTLMSEIASATHQQQAGIEQISTAVNQMDAVTQQNAALVQQSSAAAGSLSDQAALLTQLVNRFSVAGQAAPPPSARLVNVVPAPARLPSREPEWANF